MEVVSYHNSCFTVESFIYYVKYKEVILGGSENGKFSLLYIENICLLTKVVRFSKTKKNEHACIRNI